MSKEIFISSTPHETRLAIVEEDALSEVYYERENEYTLAGSIYNGKVTRVLPGMQSAFVDIGLDRDAFLYITDFMEEAGGDADFEGGSEGRSRRDGGRRGRSDEEGGEGRSAEGRSEGRVIEGRSPEGGERERGRGIDRDRGRRDRDRGRGDRDRGGDRDRSLDAPRVDAGTVGEARDAGLRDAGLRDSAPRDADAGEDADGSRRWRGRRGRRRGRGGREDEPRGERSAGDAERGGEERAGRSEFSRNDSSRNETVRQSFAPKVYRPAYSDEVYTEEAEGGASIEASAQPEPLVLPGESLSKYREPEKKTEEQPKQGAASAGSSGVVAKPSTLVEPALDWDGGLVLPGETLSRRGGGATEERSADRGSDRGSERGSGFGDRGRRDDRGGRGGRDRDRGGRGGRDRGRGRDDRDRDRGRRDEAPRREIAAAPVVTPREEKQLEEIEQQEERKFETQAMPEVTAVKQPVAEPVFEEEEAEFEPVEAEASHRVDVAAPSEFRLASPEDEQEELVEEEAAPQHEVTTIGQTGEMVSPAAEVVPQAEVETAAEPIAHEQAVVAEDAKSFAPGHGEIEEELLDDEEAEGFALHAHADADEDGDLEEETLEGAADLGSMLREMSIDEITRPEEPEEEDGDEADSEDESDEELEEEEAEFESFDSGEEGVDEDVDADAIEEELTEGETAGGEANADGTAPPQERKRRDGRRGMRRGGRDRDRRGGGGGRERGRRSMQTTNLPAISELLKPGQEILVQIAKEPIAKKGARITSHIALPGRFLVFMPTVNHTGVSRKISSDTERHRLKQILLSEKGDASGGFIVRTAAEGASEDELRSDLRFLLNLWAGIKERSESSKSPALLYHDLSLVERILRDQVSDNFSAIWVDTEVDYERIVRFLQRFHPSLIRRVKLYTKETPLFEQFGITEEINKALRSKVWLKSGGSIVINQTEALVAIDINTGKYVGKTARLEDTIVKTNLDAIPEIVRQIRLRDLGGIIIIDFIDMDERKNRHKVMQALEDELKKDRAPSKVLQFNDFGLVAITRKRVKQSLERTLSTTCGVCQGTGMVKSPVTVCNDIYVEMRKMHRHLERGDIMLRVHPDVVKQLKQNGAKWLQEMEEMAGKTILVKSDPSLHPEQFDIH